MKRPIKLLALGLALMAGLYFYDRANSTTTVVSATVLAVENRLSDKGEDTWHVTVEIDGAEVALNTLRDRPDIAEGDPLCVARITRMGRADEHRRADTNSCS